MRGKAPYVLREDLPDGITPAYAGKSSHYSRVRLRRGDHPRLCGEKFVRCSRSFTLSGSPPPMRGKVILNHLEPLSRRITPAYAGKRVELYAGK